VVTDLSWFWITFALIVPPIVGSLAAFPLWRKGESILGNIAGTIVVFGAALAFILRERVQLDRVTQACLDQGFTCWPVPSAFARYAIYAFIGLFEVIVLFSVSLKVEARLRRRGYAPEWQ
jgi:hypothetical protein